MPGPKETSFAANCGTAFAQESGPALVEIEVSSDSMPSARRVPEMSPVTVHDAYSSCHYDNIKRGDLGLLQKTMTGTGVQDN